MLKCGPICSSHDNKTHEHFIFKTKFGISINDNTVCIECNEKKTSKYCEFNKCIDHCSINHVMFTKYINVKNYNNKMKIKVFFKFFLNLF